MERNFIVFVTLIAFARAQIADPRCPPGTPNPPLHLNDPTNCTIFLTCVNGMAEARSCPPGQHWSVTHNWCDWPDRANCSQNGISCPPTNPPFPQEPPSFPHPTRCDRFFKCNWGVAEELSCPPGQHFSVQLGRCDWPEVANCDREGTTTAGTTTRAGSTTTVRTTTVRTTTLRPTTTRRN